MVYEHGANVAVVTPALCDSGDQGWYLVLFHFNSLYTFNLLLSHPYLLCFLFPLFFLFLKTPLSSPSHFSPLMSPLMFPLYLLLPHPTLSFSLLLCLVFLSLVVVLSPLFFHTPPPLSVHQPRPGISQTATAED